ncbi:MAG TPA: alpha-1,4-glucan--maltose-1-phosphate maltosyltransferase [Steroidobacteraceae bacterium]|nr:alpha-1,4-glucan--maltose-1-phosphate maltosyltransferase [Steroidobacteraceae bacterium]
MGTIRVVIENIQPQIDGGSVPVRRVAGEEVGVEVRVFTDGHDEIDGALLFRAEASDQWQTVALVPLGNDLWRAQFQVQRLGRYEYTVCAWVDHARTWQRDFKKKYAAAQETEVDFLVGAEHAHALALRAADPDARRLTDWANALADSNRSREERALLADSEGLRKLAHRYPDPMLVLRHEPPLTVEVERERALFSTWYELFPRSAGNAAGVHGTFADCEARLPYVAAMNFDVLYLPPIHPIGLTERKGANNRARAAADDVGSPWAIGAAAGGHKAVHPALGTLDDFRRLVAKAEELGIEIALDLAFQCSPDHPYVREHPEWFVLRPDGSIQYAENPPKKYQDIYPFNFETEAWRELWAELKSVVEFWIAQRVRIFRVDNPHTKPFAFWQWLIAEVRRARPDVIFLAEAFTRPGPMYRLAKLGFSQSYSYFAWRNNKTELTDYFTELAAAPLADFFRANLWPNTPDILTEYLQFGGRAAFMVRLVLAATLGASYGIYGPAFELMEHTAREPGSEEYLDSEKYQLRHWDLERPDSLRDFIARVNRIRRDNAPLQSNRRLKFHAIDNDALLAYSKTSEDGRQAVLTVVNLDPYHTQSGFLEIDLHALGVPAGQTFQAHDLLSGARYLWKGSRNYVALDPQHAAAHILRIRHHVRSELDFDYFA